MPNSPFLVVLPHPPSNSDVFAVFSLNPYLYAFWEDSSLALASLLFYFVLWWGGGLK